MTRISVPKIEFINHSSVLISNEEVGLLSDPWYQGDAFHRGWNLLHELLDDEIKELLNRITHIWISHEHPDHFSISFFNKFGETIKEKGIEILFQETKDKRVEGFLKAKKFIVRILETNEWIKISNNCKVFNFKDGFYDSGLAIDISGKKFLNLNDCEIKSDSRCSEVLELVGECDVLLSQFSYAAWKGGRDNTLWRKKAAEDKLSTLSTQVKYFKPKVLIPFASFVYFSNTENFYLNDSVNTPNKVLEYFSDSKGVGIKVMKPFEVLNEFVLKDYDNNEALEFWNHSFAISNDTQKNNFETKDLDDLNNSFEVYKERIFKNNSKFFIRLLRMISPVPAFRTIMIQLHDINQVVKLNFFQDSLITTDSDPDISMSSESLDFIFNNMFGFDTLTVNGCFEELKKGGFSKMTRTLAIENLNNIGISVNFSIFLRIDLIILFLSRLFTVSKKINSQLIKKN